MSGTPPAITGYDGTTTYFLPLTTTFTPNVGLACSSLFVQPGAPGIGHPIYLLDPAYSTFDPKVSCQPSQADIWWHQSDQTSRTGSLSLSTTLLGGYSVACPSLYTTGSTSVINSDTTLIGCCPSAYTLLSFVSGGNAAQCVSSISTGVVSYIETAPSGHTTSSSAIVSPSVIFAVQINVYLFATKTSSSSSATTTLNLANGLATKPLLVGPITTPIAVPTTPYTGQALLTGTCTEAIWTAVALGDGTVLEFPIVGCNDNAPGCCPSLPASSVAPAATSGVLPIYANNQIPLALANNPLADCPADYALTDTLCCPRGFSIYNQKAMGQTPCYIDTTTLPTPRSLAEFQNSLTSAIQATAPAGASPSITVAIITTQVFALSLPHKMSSSSSGLSTGAKAGIGVGIALGGLALILVGLLALLFRRKRHRQMESPIGLPPVVAMNQSAPMNNLEFYVGPTMAGKPVVSPYQPSHSTMTPYQESVHMTSQQYPPNLGYRQPNSNYGTPQQHYTGHYGGNPATGADTQILPGSSAHPVEIGTSST